MIEIKTYKELEKILKEFKKGTFDFLIVIGSAGIGKTFNTRRILGKNVCYVNSHTTILGLYTQAYEKKDEPMWFDDVEGLFEKDSMISLLKQFCETSETKLIQYNTSWCLEKTRKLPKQYETTSKVIMTMNSIVRLKNRGVQALLDRAILICFNPSREELIEYIKTNLKEIFDIKILDYILYQNVQFSIRDYIKIYQLSKAGVLKI